MTDDDHTGGGRAHLPEGHVAWDTDRRPGPDWAAEDVALAVVVLLDTDGPGRVLLDILSSHPGDVFGDRDLLHLAPGVFRSSRALGRIDTSFSPSCRRVGRRLPFHVWDDPEGRGHRFAIRPSVVAVFRQASDRLPLIDWHRPSTARRP